MYLGVGSSLIVQVPVLLSRAPNSGEWLKLGQVALINHGSSLIGTVSCFRSPHRRDSLNRSTSFNPDGDAIQFPYFQYGMTAMAAHWQTRDNILIRLELLRH